MELLWCGAAFRSLGASLCACDCASGCCPGQVPALPVLQQSWHIIPRYPCQETELLAPLCSKAALFGLSPDKTYAAMLLFPAAPAHQPLSSSHDQSYARRPCVSQRQEGQEFSKPRLPLHQAAWFQQLDYRENSKKESRNFQPFPRSRGRSRQSGVAG